MHIPFTEVPCLCYIGLMAPQNCCAINIAALSIFHFGIEQALIDHSLSINLFIQ